MPAQCTVCPANHKSTQIICKSDYIIPPPNPNPFSQEEGPGRMPPGSQSASDQPGSLLKNVQVKIFLSWQIHVKIQSQKIILLLLTSRKESLVCASVSLSIFIIRDSSQQLIAGQICAGYEKGKPTYGFLFLVKC